MTGRHARAVSSRDRLLCGVAALGLVCLLVMAFLQPPAADQIVTGAVAIAVGALGRLSGASAPDPPE